MDKKIEKELIPRIRKVTVSYYVRDDEVNILLEELDNQFFNSECSLYRRNDQVTIVSVEPDEDWEETVDHLFAQELDEESDEVVGDPNCPTCHGNGYFYEKHDGPGAERLACDCVPVDDEEEGD